MKRILLAAALLCLWPIAASATCSSPISGKDGTGATINLGAIVDGSSNCWGGSAVVDGTNASNKAAVKAASTAPASTDPALVVGLNPNNAANTVPWLINLTQVDSTALGVPTAYGTAPTTGNYIGVNAFVTNTNANGQATMANSSPVVIASNQSAVAVSPTTYPATAVPITASATGTTAATTATLTNVSGHTTYICGFSIRANATAAATGNATVTGVITATMNFTQWTAPNASGLGVTEEIFSPCIPASAVSTSIAVVSAAPGTGGVVSVSAWGYSI
jgi:hypothetical protein